MHVNCSNILRNPPDSISKMDTQNSRFAVSFLSLKCLMMLDVFLWLIHPEDQVIKTFIDFDCFYRLKLSVGIPFIVWFSVSGGLKTCSTLEMQKIERPPRFYLKSGYKYSSKIQSGSKRLNFTEDQKGQKTSQDLKG